MDSVVHVTCEEDCAVLVPTCEIVGQCNIKLADLIFCALLSFYEAEPNNAQY